MTLTQLTRVLLVVALASAGACSNTPTKSGLPWWPQGPGNPPGSEAAAAANEQSAPASEPKQQQTRAAATIPSATSAPTAPAAPAAPPAASGTAAPATRYGDLLFLSGQTATDAGNIAQQTDAVMQKVGAILADNRLTLANIVRVEVQLADIRDLQGMDAAYASHFRGALPARTVAEVAHLPGNALVQISVIAGR